MSNLPAWNCRGTAPGASKYFTVSMPEVLQRKIWLTVKSNLILAVGTWLYYPRLLLVESKTEDFILRSSENSLVCNGQLVKYKLLQWGKRVNAMPGC